jgi:hypothetical protein
MKFIRHSVRLALLCHGLALTALTALAGPPQAPPPGESAPVNPNMQPRPFPGGPGRFNGGRWMGPNAMRGANPMQNPARAAIMQSLSAEDRQRLFSARMAAMNDPQVRAAFANRQADPQRFRLTMRDAMIKADPSVAPTFQKIQQAVQQARGDQAQKFQKRVGFLSDDERSTLVKTRQSVQNDPAVAAARQQRDATTTPEARQQAERIYQQAVQGAMIRTDPKVSPILDKIRQQRVTEPPKAAPTSPGPPPR